MAWNESNTLGKGSYKLFRLNATHHLSSGPQAEPIPPDLIRPREQP